MLTPTHLLLLRLARRRLTEEDLTLAEEHARLADWDELYTLALHGGIVGLVGSHLERLEAAPSRVRQKFLAARLHNQLHNQVLLEEAYRLCARAEAEGLVLIPLKGVALNLGLPYDDPGLRSMCDVDLLTQREQLEQGEAFFRGQGYEPHGDRNVYMKYSYHVTFTRHVGGISVLVELHWTAFYTMYLQRDADVRLIERSHVARHASRSIRILHPEDLLLSTMLHLAAHRYCDHLKWLVDLSELIRLHRQEISWEHVFSFARSLGAHRACVHALYLARELLQAPVPDLPHRSWAASLGPLLQPSSNLVTSQGQPSWKDRALIDVFILDSPLRCLSYFLLKGSELAERYTRVRIPEIFHPRKLFH